MVVRRFLALGAALALVAGCDLPKPAGDGEIRYRDAVFSQVTKTPDVTYATAPAATARPRPSSSTSTDRRATSRPSGPR
jgi:hypothetical protein